jgi:hypothetical protein
VLNGPGLDDGGGAVEPGSAVEAKDEATGAAGALWRVGAVRRELSTTGSKGEGSARVAGAAS